ncbi:MAG: DUF4126 domain-containing protein [Pseudomonadota bacterium]
MSVPEYLLAAALGISLAAAVGFRVFVPVLVVAVAARSGHLNLAPSFDWLLTNTALAMLAVAALAEVAAYYIPGVDNVLDALTTPLALLAGTLMVAAPLWDLPPLLKWTTAVIAGGGAAGITQTVTSLLRAKSTLATGGLANPAVSTAELGGSLLLSILALLVPVAALLLVVLSLVLLFRWLRRLAARTV